jgi:hypothetical protein
MDEVFGKDNVAGLRMAAWLSERPGAQVDRICVSGS